MWALLSQEKSRVQGSLRKIKILLLSSLVQWGAVGWDLFLPGWNGEEWGTLPLGKLGSFAECQQQPEGAHDLTISLHTPHPNTYLEILNTYVLVFQIDRFKQWLGFSQPK